MNKKFRSILNIKSYDTRKAPTVGAVVGFYEDNVTKKKT